MTKKIEQTSLTKDQILELNKFFKKYNHHIDSTEMLDGYLTSIASNRKINVHESLSVVWADVDLKNKAYFNYIKNLVSIHWNSIQQIVPTDLKFVPAVVDNQNKVLLGLWLCGFKIGMHLFSKKWKEVENDPELANKLAEIRLILDSCNAMVNSDHAFNISQETIFDELIDKISDLSKIIYQQEEQKEKTIPISRNVPCPCGSGLKYKRCCGTSFSSFS
jgi:uncharacterized protein